MSQRLTSNIPAAITAVVVVLVVASAVLGWPARHSVPNEKRTPGIVVAVRPAGTSAEEAIVIYTFRLPNGEQIVGRAPISDDSAHPGFDWFSLGGGQDVHVAYDASDPATSIPYREFPLWTTISWSVIMGLVAYLLSGIATRRLRRSPAAGGGAASNHLNGP